MLCMFERAQVKVNVIAMATPLIVKKIKKFDKSGKPMAKFDVKYIGIKLQVTTIPNKNICLTKK